MAGWQVGQALGEAAIALRSPVRPRLFRYHSRMLIKTIFLLFSLALVWLPALRAQSSSGIVTGRLVNKTDPSAVPARVEIDVVSLSGGMSVIKSAATDAAGAFRIEGLPVGGPLMVRANYGSVNYHQQINFDASGSAQAIIEVYETTASMKDVKLQDVRIAFQLDGEGLRCLESYSFENRSAPPRAVMVADGSFRFSKAPGILEMPGLSVLAPGASFPLIESVLESADAQYYYSLYPLRPGVTTFEIEQRLPYQDRTYSYRKRFYQDLDSLNIGVIPQDMAVTGAGLARIQTDAQRDFAVYSVNAVKAGVDMVWTLSGGTPVTAAAPAAAPAGEARIAPMPTAVAENALIIGPVLLLGMISVLWFSFNMAPQQAAKGQDLRGRALKERREQLLNFLAILDHRFETNMLERKDYAGLREQGKSQLRRISALLGKKSK